MIQLSLPAQDTTWKEVTPNTIDVKTLILYPYFVEADANGNSFDIKKEDVQAIHDNYNKTVKFKWTKLQKLGKDIPLKHVETVANLLDHDPKALNVVGRVIGELEILERGGDPYLFATVRVKGTENVERVKDGRFSQVSIGFDPSTHELAEISWVVNGAIPGAQAIMSDGSKTIQVVNNTNKNEYNLVNLTNLKSVLLSQYENNRNKLDDNRTQIEIEGMLTSLLADGKLLPRDKLRIKTQLNKISDKQARFETFNLLSENLRTVVDYSIKSRNKSGVNWEENLMFSNKKSGILDLQKIAANCAIQLKKGHKAKMMGEDEDEPQMGKKSKLSDHEEEYDESEEKFSKKKAKMGEDYEKHEFTKKEMKHCLSIEDKGELETYLSTFLSKEDEGEDEEDKDDKKEEKEKGKFSKEIKNLNKEYEELKKQNSEILKTIAALSEGTDEARALFKKVIDLQTTSK